MLHKIFALIVFLLFTLPAYGQRENTLSTQEKIYGLSLFWQEVNYNFAFFDQVPELNWDSMYQVYLTKVTQTKDDYEYYRLLEKFCALLEDGHTNIYMPQRIDSLIYRSSFGKYRLFLENIDGKAIVTHTTETTKTAIPVGSEIVEVNNIPVKEYIRKEVWPYISSSTDYIREDWAITNLLKGPKGESIHIKIKTPKGAIRPYNLTRALNKDEIHPPFPKWELASFEWQENEIAYVSLNSFSDPKIDTILFSYLPELYKAKGLIIDLRKNGGGSTNIGMEIAKFMTKDSLLYGSRMSTREHRAAYKAWGAFTPAKDTSNSEWERDAFLYFHNKKWYQFENKPYFNNAPQPRLIIPTVILIGHGTASAAEDFLIFLDGQEHITLIGEPTYGSTGQPLFFELPGGGSARVCTKKDTYPDGREFVGYGIQPDIEVKPSVKDFIDQKDPVLEKAIKFIQEKL
jgi:C-terminal processing protease CtpA/Prc